mmetsp:Transcript_21550/g.65226  ORF Transcript_21550/g.65226 Transcript_21550/m.65226 type:complete len:121 (+) Transcript_21550:3-365(+)
MAGAPALAPPTVGVTETDAAKEARKARQLELRKQEEETFASNDVVTGIDWDKNGAPIQWGDNQKFFVWGYVLYPTVLLFLIFKGDLGWWNYDLDGKKYNDEEYKKANGGVERPKFFDNLW